MRGGFSSIHAVLHKLWAPGGHLFPSMWICWWGAAGRTREQAKAMLYSGRGCSSWWTCVAMSWGLPALSPCQPGAPTRAGLEPSGRSCQCWAALPAFSGAHGTDCGEHHCLSQGSFWYTFCFWFLPPFPHVSRPKVPGFGRGRRTMLVMSPWTWSDGWTASRAARAQQALALWKSGLWVMWKRRMVGYVFSWCWNSCHWWGLMRDTGNHVISKAPSTLCAGYFLDNQSSQAMDHLVQHPTPLTPIPGNVLSEKGAFLVHCLLEICLFNVPVSSGKIAEHKLWRQCREGCARMLTEFLQYLPRS